MNVWRLYLYALALAVVAFVAGCQLGTEQENDRRVAEVANLHRSYADAGLEASQKSLARLQAAQALGDQLTRRLQSTEAALAARKTETDREIKRLTTGRVCLSGAAVRMLNEPATGSSGPRGVPGTARLSADEDASGAATDTDVAAWASDARGNYGQCAERLNALIDWHATQGAAQ